MYNPFILNLSRDQYSPGGYSSLIWLYIAVILTVVAQTFFTFLSGIQAVLLNAVVLFVCIASCYKYSRYCRNIPSTHYFYILIIYLLVVGLIHFSFMNIMTLGWMLQQDIRYVVLFLMGGLLAQSRGGMNFFHAVMKVLGIFSILFGLFALYSGDFSYVTIEEREGTWSLSYYLWWLSTCTFCYWGYYALIMKKERLLGLGVVAIYMVLGFLFLKRSAVINVIGLFVFYVLLNSQSKVRSLISAVFLLSVLMMVLYFMMPSMFFTISNLLMDRFDATENVAEVDRMIELNAYFDSASIPQLIFGNGIGHLHVLSGYGIVDRPLNALHSGWANIIYKGGVAYVLYYLFIYKNVVSRVFSHGIDNYEKVCIGVALSSLLSLAYEGSWTYTIAPFCISAPILYVVNKNRHEFR